MLSVERERASERLDLLFGALSDATRRGITRSQQGRWRSARLSPTSLASAATWLARQEQLWTERLDQLDYHLARLATNSNKGKP
jgi:hypothetical protein